MSVHEYELIHLPIRYNGDGQRKYRTSAVELASNETIIAEVLDTERDMPCLKVLVRRELDR